MVSRKTQFNTICISKSSFYCFLHGLLGYQGQTFCMKDFNFYPLCINSNVGLVCLRPSNIALSELAVTSLLLLSTKPILTVLLKFLCLSIQTKSPLLDRLKDWIFCKNKNQFDGQSSRPCVSCIDLFQLFSTCSRLSWRISIFLIRPQLATLGIDLFDLFC